MQLILWKNLGSILIGSYVIIAQIRGKSTTKIYEKETTVRANKVKYDIIPITDTVNS